MFLEVRYNTINTNKTGRMCFLLEVLKLGLICLLYRESFPNDLQFSILMRFTVDQTQTPSLKVSILRLAVQAENSSLIGICLS